MKKKESKIKMKCAVLFFMAFMLQIVGLALLFAGIDAYPGQVLTLVVAYFGQLAASIMILVNKLPLRYE